MLLNELDRDGDGEINYRSDTQMLKMTYSIRTINNILASTQLVNFHLTCKNSPPLERTEFYHLSSNFAIMAVIADNSARHFY